MCIQQVYLIDVGFYNQFYILLQINWADRLLYHRHNISIIFRNSCLIRDIVWFIFKNKLNNIRYLTDLFQHNLVYNTLKFYRRWKLNTFASKAKCFECTSFLFVCRTFPEYLFYYVSEHVAAKGNFPAKFPRDYLVNVNRHYQQKHYVFD